MSPLPGQPQRVLDDSRILEDRVSEPGKAAADDQALRYRTLVAQSGRAAGGAVPSRVDTRTIYLVENETLQGLPRPVMEPAVAEVQDIFSFVGRQQNQSPMSVRLLEPERFPEAFNFSDSVVSVIPDGSGLVSHRNSAFRQQRHNAVRSIRALGIRVSDAAISSRSTGAPETFGTSMVHKVVVSAGNQPLAIPLMVAVVALDVVIAEVVSHFSATVNEQAIRSRRQQGPMENPEYWGSSQALLDTQALSVLDNPEDPAQWFTFQESLGAALGRVISHEARHLYISGHASDGLGGAAAPILGSPSSARFSPQDEREILTAIQRLEREQAGAIRVETYPQAARGERFPF